MSRGAGSRAISREEKRLQKEKERRIREANRMLIPVPKNTTSSMKLLSFDPAGTFRFEGNRWVRIYRVTRDKMEGRGLGELAKNLTANVRFTKEMFAGGEDKIYVSFTESAETYDEVRAYFSKDEETIAQYMDIALCSIDEAMMLIAKDDTKRFSYASMVRGRKDWKKECMKVIEEDDSSFKIGEAIGENLFVMQYPIHLEENVVERLRQMECHMMIAFDLDSISMSDQIDFGRALELKYNRHGMSEMDFMNGSLAIMFFCDSEDARAILEKTILSILSAEGFILSPSIGAQKKLAESMMSFNLIPYCCMRNVMESVINKMNVLGGQADGDD